MRRGSGLLLAALLALSALPAAAVQPGEQLADPGQESRARQIGSELRCLVCQNQSIDDSDATLAKDLRLLVRERIKAGDDDAQVLEYLTDRYGDFVLLRPRLRLETLILWFLAPGILVLGLVAYGIWAFRARSRVVSGAALSDAERTRLETLLSDVGAGHESATKTP